MAEQNEDNLVDDQGTSQEGGRQMLQSLCDQGFEGSLEQTGLVLGRTPDELSGLLDGTDEIDDDLVMKIKGIAEERGISIA